MYGGVLYAIEVLTTVIAISLRKNTNLSDVELKHFLQISWLTCFEDVKSEVSTQIGDHDRPDRQ